MNSGENSNSISIDLILEILSRLPAKSIRRFRCVSMLWASMLNCPYFTELFLTSSLARPRLLFMINRDSELNIYSSPQPQNPYEKWSLVLDADFHMKFPEMMYGYQYFGYGSGVIYIPDMISKKDKNTVDMIYNPSTRQYVMLPKLIMYGWLRSFLGFDPIDKQFKVVFMVNPHSDNDHKIMTLGTEKLRWRNIQSPLTHKPVGEGICINGILYYLAKQISVPSFVIVCFDVRSEKFKFIDAKDLCDIYHTQLINYKGKLGGINLKAAYNHVGRRTLTLFMWVVEDIEKQEWSKYVYTLGDRKLVCYHVSVVGATSTGEIVLSMNCIFTSEPFYVFYFDPKKNTLFSVEIQGFGEERFNNCRVYTVVDHVEDLKFDIMKTKHMLQHL